MSLFFESLDRFHFGIDYCDVISLSTEDEWMNFSACLPQAIFFCLLHQWLCLLSPTPSQWSTARCFIKTKYTGGLLLYIIIFPHETSLWVTSLYECCRRSFSAPTKIFFKIGVRTQCDHLKQWWVKKICWNHVYRTCKQLKPGDNQDYNSTKKNMWHIRLICLLLLC